MNEVQHIGPLAAGPCAHAEINMPGQVEKAVGTGSRPGLRDSLIMKDQAAPSQRLAGLVSIVIPCYNGAAFLAEAIESCLRQTYRELEVIVVDDASPDSCAEIARWYAHADSRVRLIQRSRNGGVSRAFNTGFRSACGEYFTRLAQDDLFREDAIALMKGYLEKHPDTGLAYCDAQLIDESGVITGLKRAGEPVQALETGNSLCVMCVMWRRSVWEEVGGFDPRFDTAEDYEYWLRVSRRFRLSKCSNEAPFYWRVHPNMGSFRFAARQDIALKHARASHCEDWLVARRLRSEGHFEAAYHYRLSQQLDLALRHLMMAIVYWPLSSKNYRCLLGMGLDAFKSSR
jgi:glycosyltransferase involved in cell wall biosynthesis